MVLATAKKLDKLYEKIYLAIVYVVGSKSKLFQRIEISSFQIYHWPENSMKFNDVFAVRHLRIWNLPVPYFLVFKLKGTFRTLSNI